MWVRQDRWTNGSASHWILIGICARRGRNGPLSGQPRRVEGSRMELEPQPELVGSYRLFAPYWFWFRQKKRRFLVGGGGGGYQASIRCGIVGMCRDMWVDCPHSSA